MAKKRKWGRGWPLAPSRPPWAASRRIAPEGIERTLQEIADQMDAWEESSEFLRTRTPLFTVNPAPEGVEEAPAAEMSPAESDFVDAAPAETEEKPSTAE